jgi:hypothetical protein
MGATMHGQLDHAATLLATAQDAQARLGTDHLWVHAAAGVLAFVQGDLERAASQAETWADLAQATEDPYEIAHSLILYATVLTDPARKTTAAEEAVRHARDAGIATALLYALFVLGQLIAQDQPDRALTLLDEAEHVAARLGDRQATATAIGLQAFVAIAKGDWRTALRVSTEGALKHLEVGESPQLSMALRVAATALANMNRVEPAAVIIGFTQAHFPLDVAFIYEELNELEAAATTHTFQTLGTTRGNELKARGANLTIIDGVAYLRHQCDRALADED